MSLRKYNKFDYFLHAFAIYLLFTKYTLLSIFEIVLYMFYLDSYTNNYAMLEKLFISQTFFHLQQTQNKIILLTQYHLLANTNTNFIFNILNIFSYFEICIYKEMKKMYLLITLNINETLEILAIGILCLLTQYVLYNKIAKNTKRKLFHFFVFIYFYRLTAYKLSVALYLIFTLLFASTQWNTKKLFFSFINDKDGGKYVLSHMFILSACTFPYYFINTENYVATIVSVCIQDAFASFGGSFIKSDKKSFFGFVCGFFAAIITWLILYKNARQFLYFFLIGIVEYCTSHNDNIIIPYLSVLWFRI